MSAPVLNSEIRGDGIIEMGAASGEQLIKEVDHLISILQAGKLPASLIPTPLQEEKIGAILGEDTIRKGVQAIAISMVVVPLFMLVYYRFAGAVAVVALMLNMLLLLASMAVTGSSITLPGLAGLALTIGMAVDANVLIFERMREEAERGAGLAQQVRNGFARAWTTILDSNVTTVLSGIVLFWVGTEEIKGFALTLIVGLIWNLFTAVYVSRAIFDLWLQKALAEAADDDEADGPDDIDFIGPAATACSARRGHPAGPGPVRRAGRAAGARPDVQHRLHRGHPGDRPAQPERPGDPGPSPRRGAPSSCGRRPAGSCPPCRSSGSSCSRRPTRPRRPGARPARASAGGRPVQHPHHRGGRQEGQEAVQKEFGPSLARLVMTYTPGEPIADAPAVAPPAPEAEAKAKASPPTATDRFAGGRTYALTSTWRRPRPASRRPCWAC
jgi:SecD/SecF fusion protein